MSRLRVLLLAGAVLVVVAVGGVYALTRPHTSPRAFTLSASPSPILASGFVGTWVVDAGSQAGYRITERFVDQPADTEAVARTTVVTGQMVLVASGPGLEVRSAHFEADLRQLKSQDALGIRGPANRDTFVGRIFLETAVYPQATFVAKPTTVGSAVVPADLTVAGVFSLHGVEHDVSVALKVIQNGDRLEVVGTIPAHLQDYKIDVPQVPFTTSSPDGTVEVHLFLKRPG
ncbi:MAG: hypothetical protein QOK05_1878 [Chloroflexota bacterium]|jgi:polyisoprenoid-binding protein YceI|nr:hypothetical protein [Chloroflexota bacterium]